MTQNVKTTLSLAPGTHQYLKLRAAQESISMSEVVEAFVSQARLDGERASHPIEIKFTTVSGDGFLVPVESWSNAQVLDYLDEVDGLS
jgi:hypothetical protein